MPTGWKAAANLLSIAITCVAAPASASPQARESQPAPEEFAEVAEIFGRNGEWKADEKVYTTSFPRTDLPVTIEGHAVPTALGFSSWVAFKHGPHGAVAMSDMVLLPDEVNPVISALEASGVEVTALHRHFQFEEPQVMYLHSHAKGDPDKIAAAYKAALEKTATPVGPGSPSESQAPAIDSAALTRITGHEGEAKGGVYKITVGRDDLTVRALGIEVTKSMGLNSWAAFAGSDGSAQVAGDLAMLAPEVNRVIRALRDHGIEIVTVHNHMTEDEPRIFFLHYWGTGRAEHLAHGFRAALDELGPS